MSDYLRFLRRHPLWWLPPILLYLGACAWLAHLIATFDPEFQDRLKTNVLLGGGGSQIKGLGDAIADYMEKHLGGGHVVTVEEPIYAGANGALKIAHDMPEEFWEKLK